MNDQINTSQIYQITGMDCADCAKMIERGVGKLDGVQSCAINFGAATLKVEGGATREAVTERVKSLGYGVEDDGRSMTDDSRPSSVVQ